LKIKYCQGKISEAQTYQAIANISLKAERIPHLYLFMLFGKKLNIKKVRDKFADALLQLTLLALP
jgi:hypothetical protein